MAPISHSSLAFAAAALLAASATDAFVLPTHPAAVATPRAALQSFDLAQDAPQRSLFRLHAEADGGETESGGAAGEGESTKAEAEAGTDAAGDGEEKEEAVEEDPEVTELKAKIAELESTIKRKRDDLYQVQEAAENYSKAGYARKVAEMDQIRKMRGVAFKSNEFTARAAAVQNFLPVLDELKALDEKYEGNDIAKSYSALRWDLNNALNALGMTEYTAEVGTIADPMRVVAVEEVYSDDHPKGTVISPVGVGMEINGNVMRMAECVVSLGSEAEAKADEGGESADAEGTNEPEEGTE